MVVVVVVVVEEYHSGILVWLQRGKGKTRWQNLLRGGTKTHSGTNYTEFFANSILFILEPHRNKLCLGMMMP